MRRWDRNRRAGGDRSRRPVNLDRQDQGGECSGQATPDRVLPDGGESQFTGEPEETQFRWGPDREEAAGDTQRALGAAEEHVADLAELADRLQMLAMNVHVKLARDDPEELQDVAYDVEVTARRVERTVAAVQQELDRIDAALDQRGAGEQPQDETGGHSDEVQPPPQGPSEGRASPQLPAGDRHPSGPWRVAGVDLTDWPGHLGTVDFERLRRRVPTSSTATSGPVPEDVSEFDLTEGELSFERILAIATADPPGSEQSDSPGPAEN
jgi:hypothetical protein